jgi:hypothetical protein
VQISPKRTNKKREKRYQLKADMTIRASFFPHPHPPTCIHLSMHMDYSNRTLMDAELNP